MTIGIAATGPWAGAGILAGLRAVESVGRGAIGGFVTLAVLSAEQKLLRAETQNGGTRGLFAGPPPEAFLHARSAALISSGPERPSPLSQFVAAAPGVGLVTGHRFPHVRTRKGAALNSLILEGMRHGATAQDAIDAVIAAHPGYDAGFIALSTQDDMGPGDMGLGNMPMVRRLLDQGHAVSECPDTGARVAILHNAIHPSKVIALLASEVALDEMRCRNTPTLPITISAGIEISLGAVPQIHVNARGDALCVEHPDAQVLEGQTSFGIGDRVKVMQLGKQIGWLEHEPFMIVKNGLILTLDGKQKIELPVLTRVASKS